jgi:hypothetical protein
LCVVGVDVGCTFEVGFCVVHADGDLFREGESEGWVEGGMKRERERTGMTPPVNCFMMPGRNSSESTMVPLLLKEAKSMKEIDETREWNRVREIRTSHE